MIILLSSLKRINAFIDTPNVRHNPIYHTRFEILNCSEMACFLNSGVVPVSSNTTLFTKDVLLWFAKNMSLSNRWSSSITSPYTRPNEERQGIVSVKSSSSSKERIHWKESVVGALMNEGNWVFLHNSRQSHFAILYFHHMFCFVTCWNRVWFIFRGVRQWFRQTFLLVLN